jgi:hypothetical protein
LDKLAINLWQGDDLLTIGLLTTASWSCCALDIYQMMDALEDELGKTNFITIFGSRLSC